VVAVGWTVALVPVTQPISGVMNQRVALVLAQLSRVLEPLAMLAGLALKTEIVGAVPVGSLV
jgi:hypothetical protein